MAGNNSKTTAAAKASATIFEQAVGFALKEQIEGGYVNDPRDPGGETNFGISKRSYPKVNIKELTREDAIAIYKRDYWDACKCDELPPEIAVAVFDCAVNQGTGIGARLLQKALRVTADGIIGPKTLAAAHRADTAELVLDFLSWRLRRYAHTANSTTYMRGWSKRVLYLLNFLTAEIEVPV
ncbi:MULTISPECIES: glycoside hydrolase family 108 protein [unclassified Phaeobacter]|uniref:glycoside hydrolase family 108 protein n=1 Tax=unclassified Phaeobacter TaxID=2621772 RepID=UPI003A8927B2